MMTFSLVNGQVSSSLAIQDRGLAYGDGLFETMRLQGGKIVLLERHLQRLKLGCESLFIPYQDIHVREQINFLISQLNIRLGANPEGVIKLIVTRGQGGKGYIPLALTDTQPSLILQYTSLKRPPIDEAGVVLHSCRQPLSSNPTLAGIKHLNRLEYILAGREVPCIEDHHGLLSDASGHVIETLHHNLFLVKNNHIFTPQLSQCGVAGVMRALLINNLCLKLTPKVFVEEVNLSIADVQQADEVFLSNSVRGIYHVATFQERKWCKGPVVKQLQYQLEQIWSGIDDSC